MDDPFDFKALEHMPKLSAMQGKVLADIRRRARASCYTTGRERTLQSLVEHGLIKMRRGMWVVA